MDFSSDHKDIITNREDDDLTTKNSSCKNLDLFTTNFP
jgi:hypothetical protein